MHTKKSSVKFSSDQWAFAICLLGFFFWSCLLTIKFDLFGFFDWDLALYAQAMQSLCHGTTYTSLFQTSFLADHSHYIAFLLVPIYALFPHPLTLIYLELFSFFAGAFIFYKIAVKAAGWMSAFVLMIIYIFHPANVFMLFYEFHFESLATGFIFLMFYFWNERKWKPFIITAMITMLIKENMALIVAMFGVYGILFGNVPIPDTRRYWESKWRWGGVIFGLGVICFLVNVFILIPYFRRDLMHTSNIYWSLYSHFGSGSQGVFHNLFFHPIAVIREVNTVHNWKYLIDCTGPFLFLSLFGPRFLIGLPILAQNLLSNASSMHTIYYHYAAILIPFAAMGAVDALSLIKTHVRKGVYAVFIALIILSTGFFVRHYSGAWQIRIDSWADPLVPVRQYMIEQIPKGTSVVTGFSFLSHLTDHQELYAFYNVWRDVNYYTGQQPFKLPDNIQYALIDFNDQWLLDDLSLHPDFTRSRVKDFFIKYKWVVKRRYGNIVLYERGK